MNPNEIFAQQQAQLDQLFQNAQHYIAGVMAFQLVLFIMGCWVVYLFYARLRDIGNELRKFRIAYEFAQEREARAKPLSQVLSTASLSVPPARKHTDAKYMPQS
jgi:hypothetical protein